MTTSTPVAAARKPSRLESAARTLLAKAEAALSAPRTTNTRRRAEMAANIVERAEREALRARVALAIVDAGGKLGAATISSLKDLEILESELSRVTGWKDADRRTDEDDAACAETSAQPKEPGRGAAPQAFAHHAERMVALAKMGILSDQRFRETLVAFVALRSSAPRAAKDPVRALERRLVGFSAPSFFPTPRDVAARMAEIGEIGPGSRVLEPSAGSGRLADAALARGGAVTCVEINHTLVALLFAKGHRVFQGDFLATAGLWEGFGPFDVVIANYPFEDGQDAIHCRRSYELLAPGGRLVAITGEGIWFREDRVAREFRSWIETVDVFHNEKLPAGTFNQSNVTQRTGVASRLIGIRKAGA